MDDLRALLAAATPGPWHFWHGDDSSCMNAYGVTSEPCDHGMTDDEGHPRHVVALTLLQAPRLADIHDPESTDAAGWIKDTSSWRWSENAALIVAAVNALPALLDVVEAARRYTADPVGKTTAQIMADFDAIRYALAHLEDPR